MVTGRRALTSKLGKGREPVDMAGLLFRYSCFVMRMNNPPELKAGGPVRFACLVPVYHVIHPSATFLMILVNYWYVPRISCLPRERSLTLRTFEAAAFVSPF